MISHQAGPGLGQGAPGGKVGVFHRVLLFFHTISTLQHVPWRLRPEVRVGCLRHAHSRPKRFDMSIIM
jgi:hypothetical protein